MKHISCMKKLHLYIIFMFVAVVGYGQNLVPNASFEDTLGCPQFYPDLDTKCKFWQSFRYSPDYMNDCSSVCGYYNQYGYQQPNSGKAYAGFAAYQTTIPAAREHIGVQLSSPLVIGTKYYISFYVSPAWNNLLANIATNKIGALVTTYQYSDPSGLSPMPNACTFYSDSVIKDTLNWYKIFGSFIADSAYQFLVIGNFFDDQFLDTINLPYSVVPQIAYYYLDDVCLSNDSSYAQAWTGLLENQQQQNNIEIYPNPASNNFHIKSNISIQQIEIINSFGQIVFVSEVNNDFEINLSSINLPNDLYFLRLRTKVEYCNKKIIIKH